MGALLPPLKDAPLDAIEALTPAPQRDVSLDEIADELPDGAGPEALVRTRLLAEWAKSQPGLACA